MTMTQRPEKPLSIAKQLAVKFGGRWTYSVGERAWYDALNGWRVAKSDLVKLGLGAKERNE